MRPQDMRESTITGSEARGHEGNHAFRQRSQQQQKLITENAEELLRQPQLQRPREQQPWGLPSLAHGRQAWSLAGAWPWVQSRSLLFAIHQLKQRC